MGRWGTILAYARRHTKRVVVTLVGGAVLFAGGVMLVTPGPGILVVGLGLAILGNEWDWAKRTLERMRHSSSRTTRHIASSPLLLALVVTGVLVLVGAAILVWVLVL